MWERGLDAAPVNGRFEWDRGMARLKVWALEPYFGGSHKYFLRGLARSSAHDVDLFALPGRHWKWRMQGGALALAARANAALNDILEYRPVPGSLPDVFFVSDMLDLPTFVALADRRLARTPSLLYFHENQLTYPLPEGVERDLTYGMRNILSTQVATKVLFNSDYHRREFLKAAEALLSEMPDEVPPDVPARLEGRTGVLPVGCDLGRFDEHRDSALREAAQGRWGDPARGPLLLWNQRWEYDKAPDRFFAALTALSREGVAFRLAMAGPNQGTPTQAFLRAREELSEHVVHWGRVQAHAEYASLLWASDVVASTALHEFFGVAVVEAVYCGCRPVLPWRLSYPEVIPRTAHADVLYGEGELIPALARALREPKAWSEEWQRTWVARFDWASLGPRYDAEIRACWRSGLEASGQSSSM